MFRINKAIFRSLYQWLHDEGHLQSSQRTRLEQKVMVFLWMCAYNEPQRNTAMRFNITQAQVSNIFHEVLLPMKKLHTQFVKQQDASSLSLHVELSLKFCQFNGAIGAMDGTHIPAHIPVTKQKRFYSRKNNVSQNVLGCVNFDGLFTYVLAGVEGSYYDSTLLKEATSRKLRIPDRRYYLADSGFSLKKGVMTPYAGTYHLTDFHQRDQRPSSKEELFNLWHAQLRNIVERTFGFLKRKWKIIRTSAVEYDFCWQVAIVYALTGLHNFILMGGLKPDEHLAQQISTLTDFELGVLRRAARRADEVIPALTMPQLRRSVARWSWKQRNVYIAARDGVYEGSDEDEGGSVIEETGGRGEVRL
jgi:DDE superfamily endonuclease